MSIFWKRNQASKFKEMANGLRANSDVKKKARTKSKKNYIPQKQLPLNRFCGGLRKKTGKTK